MQLSNLYEFIDRAVRNRNYAPNTAYGLKAALKRFEEQANEEERKSLEKFKLHLDQIYREVVTKNKNFSAESLKVYKTRVLKVINDFESYGADPTKMASWNTKATTRIKSQKQNKAQGRIEEAQSTDILIPDGTKKIEFPLRPGAKITMILPEDLTEEDKKKITKLLELM